MFNLFKKKKASEVRLKANFIEHKNIPWSLFDEEEPEFHIHDVAKEGENIRLYYQLEGKGFAVNFTDYEKYNAFPTKISVVIGHWLVTSGRWCPLERYEGSIICERVSKTTKLSGVGENYKFKVHIAPTTTKVLTLESEEIGVIEVHCEAIIPQEYKVYLYSLEQQKWVNRKDIILKLPIK